MLKYASVCSGIEIGQQFGWLTVIEIYSPVRSDQFKVKCLCKCGKQKDTRPSFLLTNRHRSCGCFRKDRMGNLFKTHGLSKTIEYTMFYDARKRSILLNLPFSILPSDITIPKICPVLGIPLLLVGPRDNRPSLDRVIPSKGYVKENISIISFKANRMKSDSSIEDLEAIILYIKNSI